jgi:hypothetical protein
MSAFFRLSETRFRVADTMEAREDSMNPNYTEPGHGYAVSIWSTPGLFNGSGRPVFCGPKNRNYFEVNQIVPAPDPRFQRFQSGRLHNLKAAGACWIHPTRLIYDTLRQHPTVASKPLPDRLGVATFKAFYDHEKHGVSVSGSTWQAGLCKLRCLR